MNPAWAWARDSRFATVPSSAAREAAVLAAVLVVGLVALAPAVARGLGLFGLSGPLPLVVGVAVAGGLYGLFVLVVDRLVPGVVVATVVTATFAADVPLGSGVDAYPGSLGPALWLVYFPLGGLVGLLALRGAYSVDSLSPVEYALGAFVLWSVAVALLGPVPRRDVALYYSIFSLVGLLGFGVAARSVRTDVVTFRGLLASFLVAVGGHVAFAVVQLANQGLFGLSMLGETARGTSHNVVGLGPLGGFNIGVFVSGLAGGNGALALLIVLALPVVIAFAVRHRGRQRTALLFALVVMAAVLRFTAKDSSRGAAIVATAMLGAFLVWEYRNRLGRPRGSLEQPERSAPLLLSAIGVLFVPSTVTADSGGAFPGIEGTGDGMAAGGTDVSMPLFNLNTLGVRIQQYVVGLDVFANHPLVGVGGANFTYVAARYDAPAIQGVSLHNLYLSLLVGTGVPGFALYVLAVALVMWSGWRLLRSGVTDRVLVAGVLAALAGYLAASFWVLPIRLTHALPFWILAGALVGEARRADEEPAVRRPDEA